MPWYSCDVTVLHHVVLSQTQRKADAYQSYTFVLFYCIYTLESEKIATIFQVLLLGIEIIAFG